MSEPNNSPNSPNDFNEFKAALGWALTIVFSIVVCSLATYFFGEVLDFKWLSFPLGVAFTWFVLGAKSNEP